MSTIFVSTMSLLRSLCKVKIKTLDKKFNNLLVIPLSNKSIKDDYGSWTGSIDGTFIRHFNEILIEISNVRTLDLHSYTLVSSRCYIDLVMTGTTIS